MGRWIFRSVVVLAAAAGFLAGIILLGQWSQEQLRGRDRYLLPIRAIDCLPPPGLSRDEFLDEVQYHARLPDRLDLLDEQLPQKLTQAFARHPWVEKVQEVRIDPPGLVRLKLLMRTPVLAIRLGDAIRVVDGHAILLPRKASSDGLPLYDGKVSPPQGPEGTRWEDPEVITRAELLARRM